MNEILDKINKKKSFKTIKSEITNLIFDEKEWIDEEMRKIPEVTYSYYSEDNFSLNETLFCNIGKANLEEIKNASQEKRKEIILKAKEVLLEKIGKKLNLIKTYLNLLKNFNTQNEKEEIEIDLIINALLEKIDLLNYCVNSIPYELEKAGIKIDYDEREIDKKQEEIDERVFGGKIIANPREVSMCYENTFEYFDKNKHNLTEQEQERFLYFLEKLKVFLPENYTYEKKEKPKSYLKKYEKFKIKDSHYIPGFNFFMDSIKKLDYKVEQKENIGSISDGHDGVIFPKNEDFEEITIPRTLKLNSHEILTHSITNYNHLKNFGNIRLAKQIEKDEGSAKFMEYMLEYGEQLFKKDEKTGKIIIDKSKFFITDVFANIAFGEILDNDELLEFLELKHKLKPGKISPKSRFLRLKRSNKNGVQHKDCSYMRGLFKLIDEVNKYIISDGKKGVKLEDLFLGKVGFDEINKFKKLIGEEKVNNSIMPNFNSEAVLFSVEQREKGEKINQEKFLEYLQKRYPILDFGKEKIQAISHKTKRNLFGVLKIIENSIKGDGKDDIDFIQNFIRNIEKLGEKRQEIAKQYI